MEACRTLDRRRSAAKQGLLARIAHLTTMLFAFAALHGAASPARAVDGCQVLMCLAAPNWRAMACAPQVHA